MLFLSVNEIAVAARTAVAARGCGTAYKVACTQPELPPKRSALHSAANFAD